MTLSAADAALHIVENPFLSAHLHGKNAVLSIAMLTVLAVVFVRGFREAIGLATWIAIPYLVLNLVVIVAGVIQIVHTPDVLDQWTRHISSIGGPGSLALLSLIAFPKLALGLSGFETRSSPPTWSHERSTGTSSRGLTRRCRRGPSRRSW